MARTVIGGEFSINTDMLKSSFRNAAEEICFSSGRCALTSILFDIGECLENRGGGGGVVLLPDYLCDSITRVVIDTHWEYEFYHINVDFGIDISSLKNLRISQHCVLLVVNYFGMTDHSRAVRDIKKQYPDLIIVEDNVQSFFEKRKDYVNYSFNSLRKWFPCPDGAVVKKYMEGEMGKFVLQENKWVQYKFAGNLLKSMSAYVDDDIPLGLIEKGEALLEENYWSGSSDVSKKIYEGLDFCEICEKRRNNAVYLHTALSELKIVHLFRENQTPFFVPILIHKRDSLRALFFQNHIFTPRHWNYISSELNGQNQLYDMELSLICDQRYGIDDMARQIDVIQEWMKGR